jgi:hypothetical protein
MSYTDPIRRVSVVSTGNVRIHPDHVASTWRPTYWWLLTSRHWTQPRPINVYVIEHRHLLEHGHLPGVGDRRRLRAATAMVNTLRRQQPGLVILPAHDPGAAGRLAAATGETIEAVSPRANG